MPHPAEREPLDVGDWFPWRMFVYAAGGACGLGALLMAFGGLVTAEIGVSVVEAVTTRGAETVAGPEIALPMEVVPSTSMATDIFAASVRSQTELLRSIATPFAAGGAANAAVGLWRLAAWTLFGAAVARIAALHFTHNEIPSPRRVFRRAAGAWASHLAGFVAILMIVGMLCLGLRVLSAATVLLPAFVLWPLAIVAAVPAALLVIGLTAGWPLMIASSAVERPDPFDAVSCGLAYVSQAPLRLAVYVVQAWIVGAAAGAIAHFVVGVTLALIEATFAPPGFTDAAWRDLLLQAPMVYHASYFWFAAAAIYLLLRRDIDEKQADEIVLDEGEPSAVYPSDEPAPSGEPV